MAVMERLSSDMLRFANQFILRNGSATFNSKSRACAVRPLVACVACLVLLACASACATTAKYNAMLDTWKGHSAASLIESWGPPDNVYSLADRGQILEYSRQVCVKNPAFACPIYSPTPCFEGAYQPSTCHRCTTRFTTDEFNLIIKWSWEGDSCKAF